MTYTIDITRTRARDILTGNLAWKLATDWVESLPDEELEEQLVDVLEAQGVNYCITCTEEDDAKVHL